MGDRKWEDLAEDCLVNIFGRVGLESLVEGVPYVCKSWFKATLSPLCWQYLIIPSNLPGNQSKYKNSQIINHDLLTSLISSLEEFIKFVIRRSHGSAIVVDFTYHKGVLLMSSKVLKYIGEGCPSLMKLVVPHAPTANLPSLICKWRELVALETDGGYLLNDVISQLSVHCKSFLFLRVTNAHIGECEASSIATLLPSIKYLCLRCSEIRRTSLLMILTKCKKLVYFNAGIFYGFDLDEEIKNLASPIKTFIYEVGPDYEAMTKEFINRLESMKYDEGQ